MFELLGCPIVVEPEHMSAIVRVESAVNPFAIGVVGHYLSRQPATLTEAMEIVEQLRTKKHNYSVGIAQINQVNFESYGLNNNNLFDVCTNLSTGSKILKSCYERYSDWNKAYSCYYSGNSRTGFRHGYVTKIQRYLQSGLVQKLNYTYSTAPIKILARGGKSTKNNSITSKSFKGTLLQRRLMSTLNKDK